MKKKLCKKMKIEKVYWQDIHALSNQWRNIEESKIESEKKYNFVQFTVGFVVYEDDRFIVLAATGDVMPEENGRLTFNDSSMIPQKNIISRKIIGII
jgi:hypothetical protein